MTIDEDELREIADRMGEWKSVFNHIIRINGWNAADFGQEIED
jgi:hypothetical protein